jgi:REP element-mobilizing transposase RayT
MSQSLSAIYIHAIFGTKKRKPFIDQSIEIKLHSYMAGIMKGIQNPALKINSMPDHVHILFRMSKVQTISDIMCVLKKDSSKWMKTQGYTDFSWQIGYAAFSVNPSKVKIVTDYICNQKEHHKKEMFVQEIEKFMDKYDVEKYSREYFWE